MSRIMALDWGKKRIGVALSDPTGTLASPFTTLEAYPRDRLMERLREIVRDESVEAIIVGLPVSLDGHLGESAIKAQAFAEEVTVLGIPVETYDERFTSSEATQRLQKQNRKPSRKKGLVDRAAAAIFLQDYLDEQKPGC